MGRIKEVGSAFGKGAVAIAGLCLFALLAALLLAIIALVGGGIGWAVATAANTLLGYSVNTELIIVIGGVMALLGSLTAGTGE